MRTHVMIFALVLLSAACPWGMAKQGAPDRAQVVATQKEAMAKLQLMDGVWRGQAWTLLPSGERHELTQTERVGPFLDGALKIIEGRGYEADGTVGFNALGIISYDVRNQRYTMRSYVDGHSGDFVVRPRADGFDWEIPAGPFTMRYHAVIKDGVWTETGDRLRAGAEPVRFFEMTLTRVDDTEWPRAGAIAPGGQGR